MTTIEEDAYTCGVCGHNFKANDDIVIFADKQGRACCDYCPDEAEEEEVCDDEQRSYGPRGAPAPESDDEEDVDARDAPNIYPYKKCSVCGERKSCGNYKENDWFCEGCWSGAKCDDCGGPIRDTENLDTCWTNDGEIFWCEYCREEHVEEYIRERDGEDDACDCCGEHFAELNTAEDAEGEKETYCDGCWKDKIEDGCVWKDENGEWVC